MEQLKALQEQVEHLTKLIKELAKPDIYDYIDENMPEWARTVSYTHLDVYKRQILLLSLLVVFKMKLQQNIDFYEMLL